ncbi:MAG TPA: hypothetical protein VJ464_24075 [Blastocatellia bacterium]|nr:hypothetical protein [Blastocatellia bacterium]
MDLNQLAQISLKEFLGLTVVGALVTTTGTLIALFLKEWFFARSFEDWKSKRSLETFYRKYKDPILLAAMELSNRLEEICKDYPTNFLKSELLKDKPQLPARSSAVDPYYNRYKFQSSAYRLCAFLGWIELFRQDVVFLYDGRNTINQRVEDAIRGIRGDLADGHLNNAPDWDKWCDALIFREEQRAIGEPMISTGTNGRVVLGYGEFSQFFAASPSVGKSQWIQIATRFLADLQLGKDFRLIRMKRLIVHLVDLIDPLDHSRLSERHKKVRLKYKNVLSDNAT